MDREECRKEGYSRLRGNARRAVLSAEVKTGLALILETVIVSHNAQRSMRARLRNIH